MGPPLRSIKGCWTCRLRRKKCDETHPTCLLCDSLVIPCYGYGPRPDWMDGGEIEKTKLESFKHIVKHTSRRRGKPTQKRFPLQSHSDIETVGSGTVQTAVPYERVVELDNTVPGSRNPEPAPPIQSSARDECPDLLQSSSSSLDHTMYITPEVIWPYDYST